ncbi:MAG: serine/threonine-protein kinase [Calditrichota bacterium]
MQLPFSQIGDVQLTDILYAGPYNLVVIGEQSNLQRRVLVKLLRPGLEGEEDRIKRFQKEARACARLKHPHIVDVHKLGEEQGYHYIILEYVDGLNLEELVEKNGPVEESLLLQIADEVLQALVYAHTAGVTHRDIKPANVLLGLDGRVKVTDFGLAKVEGDATVTHQDSMVGSPAYMSPEQITGDNPDGRADLFSLGCLLYELLTGKQAFEGDNFTACLHKILNEDPLAISEYRRDINTELEAFVMKLLAKRAEERWASAEDALLALRALEVGPGKDATNKLNVIANEHQRVLKPTAKIVQKSAPQKTSRRWTAWTGGAVAITFVLIIAVSLQESFAARNSTPLSVSPVDTSLVLEENPTLVDEAKVITVPIEVDKTPAKEEETPTPDIKTPDNASTINEIPLEQQDSLLAAVVVPKTGKLRLNIEPWATVFIDEEKIDERVSELELDLAVGSHTVRLAHPNFPPSVKFFDIEPGNMREFNWSFYNSMGYLDLSVRPWADIYLNDKLYGTTPLNKPLMLPPGSYLLELRHPQSTRKDRIVITKGDTLTRRVTLNLQ